MKKICKCCLLLVSICCLFACSDSAEDEATTNSSYEKVKIAIILPKGPEGNGWDNVLGWVANNIRKANNMVEPDFEFYDENSIELESVAEELANREDIVAIVGCYNSEHTMVVARKCARKYKPMFTFSTSEELQRAFGQRGFLWCLSESDITQSELLLAKAARYQVKRVALLASDGIYGQTFQDWFSFQAVEFGLDPIGTTTFSKDNLDEKFSTIIKDNPELIICAPSSAKEACQIVSLSYEYNYMGRLLFSSTAYSQELIQTLGERSNGIEGIAGVSDPTTGFDISYLVKFDTKPYLGESAVYDAVMVTCYAYRYAAIHNIGINEAIAKLLNSKSDGKGMWTESAMQDIFTAIEQGNTPAFSGASGNLDFSTEHYTTVLYSSYVHWMIYEGNLIHLDYDNRSQNKASSALAAWEWNKQFAQQFENDVPEITYPALKDKWAVVVAASTGWMNYRHQADALAFYQFLKENGYDDEHIILIMADDLASNPNNPYLGTVKRLPNGENLYHDVEIDYNLSELKPEDFRNILIGKDNSAIKSSDADNVLLFWSGHGNKGELLWGDDDVITSKMISEIFQEMAKEHKFRKMLCLIEACYSGSVAEKCENIPGLLMLTAANGNETSKADIYNNDLGVWMTNRFTSCLLDEIAKNPDIPLRELYYNLFQQTLGSHVSIYNANSYGSVYNNSMREYLGSNN